MPDRTFHSLATTWRLITQDSPTDVKELIPELFYLPELFYNTEGLALGVRQCGARVDDVELPQWAADARLFTLVHRQALEAPLVAERLPLWIDLVFGYKQTGQAAIDAINVFPACVSVLSSSVSRLGRLSLQPRLALHCRRTTASTRHRWRTSWTVRRRRPWCGRTARRPANCSALLTLSARPSCCRARTPSACGTAWKARAGDATVAHRSAHRPQSWPDAPCPGPYDCSASRIPARSPHAKELVCSWC